MSKTNENDEIREFKTISIEEGLKIQKDQRKQEQEEFEKRLSELKSKTQRLKEQFNYKNKKRT